MQRMNCQPSVAIAGSEQQNKTPQRTGTEKMILITTNDTDAVFARLQDTLTAVSRECDMPLQTMDGYIQRLNDLGLFHRNIICGPIVMTRSYGIDGPSDSGQLVQAAVTTDHGAAVIFWDSEDYYEANQSQVFEEEAMSRTVALCDCTPAIRSIVWPHIADLVERLMCQVVIE